MNKILKLTSVSMLAIAATTNANAAGYTCEELVEYTSCNPGYWLDNEGSNCPDGYSFGTGWCITDGDLGGESGYTKESCLAAYCDYSEMYGEECDGSEDYYLGDGCFKISDERPDYEFIEWGAIIATCKECPIGSTCSGGTAGATPCPAGSYCATAGLSQPTGKCAVGTFANAGATSCTSCPATSLTDKNGATVVATTVSTGSTSASACYVGNNVEFKDAKGIWHYKSECAHGNYPDMFPAENGCPDNYVSAYLEQNNEVLYDETYCVYLPKERCDEMHVYDENYDLYEWTWDGSKCSCFGGADISYDKENDSFSCNW